MEIDDLKLELKALQIKDTENAINSGFNNKDEWLKHILNSQRDEIAEAIIDLANRYKMDQNIVAKYFDPTMIIRIIKVQNQEKTVTL